jgi:transcriptional regulator with XRE-family HTH domain
MDQMAKYSEAMTLAEMLVERATELGDSTYQQIADRMGTSQPTVSRWMNGQRPGTKYVDVIADYLDTNVATVLVAIHGVDLAIRRMREEARALGEATEEAQHREKIARGDFDALTVSGERVNVDDLTDEHVAIVQGLIELLRKLQR